MKKFVLIFLIIIIISLFYAAFHIRWIRLFSPGALSYAHENFDKEGKCDACHTQGKRLDNKKCLDCHTMIKIKYEASSGLHGNKEKMCSDCHSEHHGKNYDLAYFDIASFDHSTTGWALGGKHDLLRCEACHKGDSYLLDDRSCIDCHKDVHLGQLGKECNTCHKVDSFNVPTYNHKPGKISPKGKHLFLPCDECHRVSTVDFGTGKGMAVKYKGIDFSCHICHEDVHEGEYGKKCIDCHNQNSFEVE
ncbi:MAG: hypothetical protein ACMUJM_03165 [bacterium]